MTKGNTKKTKESLVKQPAAKQSGSAAKMSETAIVPGKALRSPAAGVTVQPPATAAGIPERAAVVAEAPAVSQVRKVKATFMFPVCECRPRYVSLSGDFNGWSPNATPMKQYDDGHWETTLDLAPGRYEYKFVRDGEWMPDLLARENVLNRYGTLNSVIEIGAS